MSASTEDIKNCLKNINREDQKNLHINKTISIYLNDPNIDNLKEILKEIERTIITMYVFERMPKKHKELIKYRYIDGLSVMQTAVLLKQKSLKEAQAKRRKGNYTTFNSIKITGPKLINNKIKPELIKLTELMDLPRENKSNTQLYTPELVIGILQSNIIDRKKIKKAIIWTRNFYRNALLQIKDKMTTTEIKDYNRTKNETIKKIYGPAIAQIEDVENVKNQLNCLDEKKQQLLIEKYVYGETDVSIAKTHGYKVFHNKSDEYDQFVSIITRQAIEQITEMCNIAIISKSSFKEDLIA